MSIDVTNKISKFPLPNSVSRFGYRVLATGKRYSPELILGAGCISLGYGIYKACKSTLVVDDILKETESTKERMHTTLKDATVTAYDEDDYDHDIKVLKIKTGITIVKEYAPAAAFITVGVGCILVSHHILSDRVAGLTAAAAATDRAFATYRERVVDRLGADEDFYFLTGAKDEEIIEETVNSKGQKRNTKNTIANVVDTDTLPKYVYLFDECHPDWARDPDLNRAVLTCREKLCNQKLEQQGYIFLNDVLEIFGYDKEYPDGNIVGWLWSPGRQIDCGMRDVNANHRREAFLGGYEPSVLLDFTPDGPILDKIGLATEYKSTLKAAINGRFGVKGTNK